MYVLINVLVLKIMLIVLRPTKITHTHTHKLKAKIGVFLDTKYEKLWNERQQLKAIIKLKMKAIHRVKYVI